eukprot:scaffold316493_cov18-Tisochrysis_lutea.AAC.1
MAYVHTDGRSFPQPNSFCSVVASSGRCQTCASSWCFAAVNLDVPADTRHTSRCSWLATTGRCHTWGWLCGSWYVGSSHVPDMGGIVERLLLFLDSHCEDVVAETLVQMKDLLRRYPDMAEVRARA